MLKKKYLSGGVVLFIGLAAAIISRDYGLGSLSRMGAGYYPFLLGLVLMALGLLIAVAPESRQEALHTAHSAPLMAFIRAHLRPWCCVLGGVLAFVVLGSYGGLVAATFAMVLITALGDHNNTLKACFWLAVSVTAFAVVVFHFALQMQFPLFAWG